MLRLIKPCLELEDAYEDFRADWKANHDKIIPAAVRGVLWRAYRIWNPALLP